MKKIDYILIISVFLILWIDYIPYKLPSFVDNPEKFEFVIYNLSLAYVASYIFYYINTYLPEKRNSRIVRRVVNNSVISIIENRKKLNDLKGLEINEKFEISSNGKILSIEEFLQKNQKDLHNSLNSILTIQERLPTAFLNYSLLLKNHPYFKSNFKNLDELEKYIEAYDLLSRKLYLEFKKL